jgi:predicted molibdopterin-dependent oxidoreductase YjgC
MNSIELDSIKLWINDREVETEPGRSIMEAADRAGVHIPRLCYHPSLKPSGACRLCAVEVDGCRGLPAACSTPVEQGMRIRTETPKVVDFRREMLRLILREHPRECLGCPRNGTCELQRLVEDVGIDFPYQPPSADRPPVQAAGAYFERDMSLCVRCGRCVRICHEVRGSKAIVFREVEGRQEVGTAFGRSLEESGCQFCGACVDVCPVGALREKLEITHGETNRQTLDACEALASIVVNLYRKEMPTQWKSSICPMCGANCRMSFELSEHGEIIQARPEGNGRGSQGQACVQGRFLLKSYLQRPDRLRKPLVLENGRYRESEWENVLDELARRFQSYGPWETAVLTDAGLTTEELFLLQKFARTALRTNVIGCITPWGYAAAEEALSKHPDPAAVKGSIGDLSKAGVVLAVGVNPPASHPVAGTVLREATLNGTKLIVANPLSMGLSRYADINLHHLPGKEAELIGGLIRLLLDENREDPAVVARNPLAVSTMKKNLAGYEPDLIARITGVSVENLTAAASLLGKGKPVTVLYGLGLVQSPALRESIDAMVALLHLTGSVSKAGGGLVPLYGSGNLQGASDLGMVSKLFGAPGQGTGRGGSASGDVLEILASSQVKAVYLAFETYENGLFDSLRPYLDKLELVVLHDTVFPPSQSLEQDLWPHVVLPMASVLEKGGAFTTAERKPIEVPPVIPPPGEARSVSWVLRELAQRMKVAGFGSQDEETSRYELWWEIAASTTLVRKARKVPSGCCCCGTPVTVKASSDCQNDMPEWKPMPLGTSEGSGDDGFPFAAIAKESLEPYFLGPLLAVEAKTLFYPDCEIEMNPSDVFGMGLMPGDTVRIVTVEGREHEGRLGLNPLLPPKMVTAPAALLELKVTERSAVKIGESVNR